MTLAACGAPTQSGLAPQVEDPHTQLAADDDIHPGYSNPDLEKALIAERGAEATNERRVADAEAKGDSDALVVATADLHVRQRFIKSLETCQQSGHLCPPRLDDPAWKYDYATDGAKPTLDTVLRFDLADWRAMTTELHGRACACRTIACVESMDVALNDLETHPTEDVRADEQAITELTHARECLFRLRGKSMAKPNDPLPPSAPAS
jgi:hypothetical protein